MTTHAGVELAELETRLQALHPTIHGAWQTVVRDVCQDSRQVNAGALFVGRRGERFDGTRFVADAVLAGAAAVMLDRSAPAPSVAVPLLLVDDVELAIGPAAEAVHGDPSRALQLVGITGTNGKTTCASLVRQCLDALGEPCAQLGTLGSEFGGLREPGGLTTPEPDQLSRFLARARAAGARRAVMEVSSHALAQHRVDGLSYRVAAFTNLTRDHLDYHRSMEEYERAKARLFEVLQPGRRVINVDDGFGAQLASRSREPVITVSRSPGAEISCESFRCDARGAELVVRTPAGCIEYRTGLVGEHNVDNWLLTLGVLHALDVRLSQLVEIAPTLRGAPGRMERCEEPDDELTVLVDYAHTPDALERVLVTSKRLAQNGGGRLICVFGCGGDRDRGKRPLMGGLAARIADVAIVTSDNPRSEDPEAIAEQIEQGMHLGTARRERQLDRRQAIFDAVTEARRGDVVLIAGKGHEDYQLIGAERLDFDDRRVAKLALAERRGEG